MTDILDSLLEMNLAAAAAILFVLLVRKPARTAFGPHAIYLLWAIVPIAVMATFIPSRTIEMITLDVSIYEAALQTAAGATGDIWAFAIPAVLIAIWLIGAGVMATALARRQAAFLRDADLGLAGPAIVGFSHPRIVTPDDFSRRFSDAERKLILTHEQVHLDRSDARVNAFVAFVRCAFWFNPLVHVGAKAMRVDQELSCDAEVIDRRPRVRRAYAETLLKTQLASRPLPVGCYWPAESQHPLAERIDMLARKPLSGRRRAAATGLVLVLAASAGVAAWAAQPERTVIHEAPDILVPFNPLPPDQQAADTTRPRLVSGTLAQPLLPMNWAGRAEIVTELCVSRAGAVDSVLLVKPSGDATLDVETVAALQNSKWEPARRAGKPVAICGHPVTMVLTDGPRADTGPP